MAVTLPAAVSTTNVDSGAADTPKNARADIKTMFDAWNTVRAQIDAIGIMQIGDGVENEAQAAGTKDKLRVKLDGAGTTSGLSRSASGLKIAANGVTRAMFERGATSGQVLTAQGAGADPIWSTPATGEVNTSSNVGTGVQAAKSKVGVDLPFRSFLVSVTNATVSSGTLTNCSLAGSWSQNTNDLTLNLTLTRTYNPGGGGS